MRRVRGGEGEVEKSGGGLERWNQAATKKQKGDNTSRMRGCWGGKKIGRSGVDNGTRGGGGGAGGGGLVRVKGGQREDVPPIGELKKVAEAIIRKGAWIRRVNFLEECSDLGPIQSGLGRKGKNSGLKGPSSYSKNQ